MLIAKVTKRIFNNSANKKGCAPNLNIGLSQPINSPSQNIPRIYINNAVLQHRILWWTANLQLLRNTIILNITTMKYDEIHCNSQNTTIYAYIYIYIYDEIQ